MTVAKTFVSLLSLAAIGTALPAAIPGQELRERQNGFTTTITLYQYGTPASATANGYAVASATNTAAAAGSTGTNSPVEEVGSGFHDTDTTLPGISYAPYRGDHGCKTADQINDDFNHLTGSYSTVRIYGTDCDQVALVHNAAKNIGVKLILGIWDINAVQSEADKIIAGVKGDWDRISTVSVGNELVNNGQASPVAVVSAVKQARDILRKAGYTGPVVTVDTFVAMKAHPELCEASDYCAVNAHAFFDSTITADQAGSWLQKTVESVKAACPKDKKVVVTESGWPMKGQNNGAAVPGLAEQASAIKSIKAAFAKNIGDVVLFSAFNTPWKSDEINFKTEPYWGINGTLSKSDM